MSAEPDNDYDDDFTLEEEAAELAGSGLSCGVVATTLIMHIFQLVAEVLKSLWWIALIGTSLQSLSALNWDLNIDPVAAELEIEDFMGWGGPVGYLLFKAYVFFREASEHMDLDDMYDSFDSWDCTGVKLVISVLLIVVLCLIVHYVNSHEVLFKIGIRCVSRTRGFSRSVRIVLKGLIKLLLVIVLYILQLAFLLMYRVIILNYEIQLVSGEEFPDCGEYDEFARKASIYLLMVVVFFVVIWYLHMFSGRRTNARGITRLVLCTPCALLCYPFRCGPCHRCKQRYHLQESLVTNTLGAVKRIVLLTFGVWTEDMQRTFNVVGKARSFPVVRIDHDNYHEAVLQITAKSRSVFYLIVPFCVLLAKTTEFLSDPSIFILSKSIKPRPFGLRFVNWLFAVTRIVFTVLFVFDPQWLYIAIIIGSLIPPFIVNTVYDMRKAAATRRDQAIGEIMDELDEDYEDEGGVDVGAVQVSIDQKEGGSVELSNLKPVADAALPVDPLEKTHQQQQLPIDPLETKHQQQQLPIDPLEKTQQQQQLPIDPLEKRQQQQLPIDPLEMRQQQQLPIDPLERNAFSNVDMLMPVSPLERQSEQQQWQQQVQQRSGFSLPNSQYSARGAVLHQGAVLDFEPVDDDAGLFGDLEYDEMYDDNGEGDDMFFMD